MNTIDPALLERASRITLLALDVDGVLSDGKIYFDSAGNELKSFYTRDGLGIRELIQCGITIALITGRESPMVTDRARQLGIEYVFQGSVDKLTAYMDLLEQSGATDEQVCYAGDDWIDLPVLKRVGLAVTVPAADDVMKDNVHMITSREGGEGAVREICDLILKSQDLHQRVLSRFLDA